MERLFCFCFYIILKIVFSKQYLYFRYEGLVYSRLYGELVPQCLQNEDQDDLPEKICSIWRNSGVKDVYYTNVTHKFVSTDAFSAVYLNEQTMLSLRAGRDYATVKESPNDPCSALYVVCE